MPCFHPLQGYRARHVNPASGKRSVVFDPQIGYVDRPVTVPCGRCIGCRLERSRQWAMRCVHEASMHADNAFITLTYNDQHLPAGGTLIKKDFWDFAKRLRRSIEPSKIRIFYCGEYGERCKVCDGSRRKCVCPKFEPGLGRPHFHALLFGHDFADKQPWRPNGRGDKRFTSESLSRLWGMGFVTTGAVTFESAAYVARYCTKKKHGDEAEAHYRSVVADTGEIIQRVREFAQPSLRPAISKGWLQSFMADVYPDDFVVLRGQQMKPPKYYDRLHETDAPAAHGAIKAERARYGRAHEADSTPERLAVRKKCKEAQISQLKRELE